jgi:hypothetical protein
MDTEVDPYIAEPPRELPLLDRLNLRPGRHRDEEAAARWRRGRLRVYHDAED